MCEIIGVISDTHIGNKRCMEEQIMEFYSWARKVGARRVLHAGDVVDRTDYEMSENELSLFGGIETNYILGNHDPDNLPETDSFKKIGKYYAEASYGDVGIFIQHPFRDVFHAQKDLFEEHKTIIDIVGHTHKNFYMVKDNGKKIITIMAGSFKPLDGKENNEEYLPGGWLIEFSKKLVLVKKFYNRKWHENIIKINI